MIEEPGSSRPAAQGELIPQAAVALTAAKAVHFCEDVHLVAHFV